jgi:hypothetical protein
MVNLYLDLRNVNKFKFKFCRVTIIYSICAFIFHVKIKIHPSVALILPNSELRQKLNVQQMPMIPTSNSLSQVLTAKMPADTPMIIGITVTIDQSLFIKKY